VSQNSYTTDAIAERRGIMEGYRDQITDPIPKSDATIAMEAHLNALEAYLGLTGASASSYSSPLGQSVNRRAVDEARRVVDDTWARFVSACAIGGIILDGVTSSIGYWELA
jgi:hypothetical protein